MTSTTLPVFVLLTMELLEVLQSSQPVRVQVRFQVDKKEPVK